MKTFSLIAYRLLTTLFVYEVTRKISSSCTNFPILSPKKSAALFSLFPKRNKWTDLIQYLR